MTPACRTVAMVVQGAVEGRWRMKVEWRRDGEVAVKANIQMT